MKEFEEDIKEAIEEGAEELNEMLHGKERRSNEDFPDAMDEGILFLKERDEK